MIFIGIYPSNCFNMPIYEYECDSCGSKFELLRKMSDSDSEVQCPKCSVPNPKRLFSSFGAQASKNACSLTAPT